MTAKKSPLSPSKKYEIQVLLRAEHKQKEVAELAGVSLRTVQRIATGPVMAALDEVSSPRPGRPSDIASRLREQIAEWLTAEPDIPTVEVLARARDDGYDGGKTALYLLVRSLRQTEAIDWPPGAVSEHDYGWVRVRLRDGADRRLAFFVTRLPFSRWTQASILRNLEIETLIRCMLAHFAALGGLPSVAVFLHPKPVRWCADPVAFHWTAAIGEMALRLGFGIELDPARSYFHSNTKQSRLSDVLRRALSKLGPFEDSVDVSEKVEDWTYASNHSGGSRDSGLTPATLFEKEQRRLRPFENNPEDIPLRFTVWVRANGTVLFEGHALVLSPELRNRHATLNLYPDRVQLVADQFEVWHPWPPDKRHD